MHGLLLNGAHLPAKDLLKLKNTKTIISQSIIS